MIDMIDIICPIIIFIAGCVVIAGTKQIINEWRKI